MNHMEFTPNAPVPFHTLLGIGTAIEKVLIDHEITIHPHRKMSKYVETKETE